MFQQKIVKLLQLFKYTSDENAAVQFIYYHDDYDDLDVLETDEEFNAMTRIMIDYYMPRLEKENEQIDKRQN